MRPFAPRRSEEEGWGFDDDQKEAKAREKRIEERKREKEKERVEREKAQPVGGKRRRRAAAENAEERTRQELEGDTTKDDSDDDFKDAAADKELSEGRLGVREQAAPSYKDAVSAAKREKLVAKAAADLGFDSDDDEEMAPAPRKKKKVKKSPDSKKKALRQCRRLASTPPRDALDASLRVAPRSTQKKRPPRNATSSREFSVARARPPSCGAPTGASRNENRPRPARPKKKF